MLNFCTLFDVNYLSRGLAMYESLFQHCRHFHLYVFAFDNQSREVLTQLQLDRVTVISLTEFEDAQLLAIKPTRTRGEYCWTCTPSTIRYVLTHFPVDSCTYLDADLYFYADPGVLLDELDGKSVLITEHRFSSRYEFALVNGKYCVQFVTFKNDAIGQQVLDWWRQACLDWCYQRLENGKFGDQKYLDDWTTRFPGIHELQHLGGEVAPWNVQQYRLFSSNNQLFGQEIASGQSFEVVFYHFHALRFMYQNQVDLGEYVLSAPVEQLLYRPYLRHLEKLKVTLQQIDPDIRPNEEVRPKKGLDNYRNRVRKVFQGWSHNVYDKTEFLNYPWPESLI